jgi:hypothetical protein
MEASGDFRHSDLSWGGHWYGRGENIGWHQGYGENCTFLHNSFMNSSGHRANILRASFDMVGIGVVYDPVRGGILHVTVTFGDSDGTNWTVTEPVAREPTRSRHATVGVRIGVRRFRHRRWWWAVVRVPRGRAH